MIKTKEMMEAIIRNKRKEREGGKLKNIFDMFISHMILFLVVCDIILFNIYL